MQSDPTIILKPGLDRTRVMDAMRAAGIEFRMITGGCFLRHEAIRFFDYDTVGSPQRGEMRFPRRDRIGSIESAQPLDCAP